MERRRGLGLAIGLVAVFLLLTTPFVGGHGSAAAASSAQPKLQIGLLVCLTGWFSVYDTLEWDEAQVARDIINEKGGIAVGGQKYLIELIPEDCKSTVDGVVAAAKKLVYEDKVQYIAGPAAFFSAAAKGVTEPSKVLRAIAWCTNTPGELDASTPYTFLSHDATVEFGIMGSKHMKQAYPDVKSVDLLIPDDGTIKYLGPILENIYKQQGLSLVNTVLYPNEGVNFGPIAARLNSSKADAVMMQNGIVPNAAGILKALREMGSNKPFAVLIGANAADVMAAAGKPAATHFFAIGMGGVEMPDMPPTLAEIQKRLLAKYGRDRSMHLQIVNSIFEFVQVIEKAKSIDTTKVRDTWEKLNTMDTPYGTGNIGGLKTYGIKHAVSHRMPVQTVENGQAKFVTWIEPGVVP
jgi:branched-chain amino acid transport system substrate-binding protein